MKLTRGSAMRENYERRTKPGRTSVVAKWVAQTILLAALICLSAGRAAEGQAVATTTVQGTVYLANGQPGSGTLAVSWPSFTTAAGQAVAAGRMTVTIAPDGFMSVKLAPNLGAKPAGLFYTAVYQLSDGSTNTEYWVVPAAAQAALGTVRAQVMPAAQAVQAVTKTYVDQLVSTTSGEWLPLSGGTMTGPLTLSADPVQPLQASDKHYVDQSLTKAVPLSGGNMTGALTTPSVNGIQLPSAVSAQTTLQAAVTAAGTIGAVEIPPTYTGTDTFTNTNGVYVKDWRTGGAQQTERSVKEFGAVCDGTTDDTSALQTALNYANAHGVALTLPQGVCKTHTLTWYGESIGGAGKQVSALKGFPGEDVLATPTDSTNILSYTRLHDLTIYVDLSVDASCATVKGRGSAGSCAVSRAIESGSIFSAGGNGLTATAGTGAGWYVGNCAIAMPALTGVGGNGLKVASIENVEIASTGTDPLAATYTGAYSTHTCGMYLAQWPRWSEFRNIDIRGLNTGIAIPALAGTTPSGLNADSNRWENITIQAAHGFVAAAGSNNVLDNVVAHVGNSAATAEAPTGLVLDLTGTQYGWTVRNAVMLPTWMVVQPTLTVAASGGAITGVTVGSEAGLGFDPYGTSVPVAFSGSCTAAATAAVNSDGSIGAVTVTQGGVGCSSTNTASINVAGTWDTAAPVNLIGGQNLTFVGGNLQKGTGGYTVWNAASSQTSGTQVAGGGGNLPGGGTYGALAGTSQPGKAFDVDQFPGADFGAKLQACVNAVSATYGGTCDARNFTGTVAMSANVTIAKSNTTVLLPCATIATANQLIIAAAARNVSLRGCALRGGSLADGTKGGTAIAYTGSNAAIQVGDATYAVNTLGFHMDNMVVNTVSSPSATAQGLAAYRTQEMDVESVYFLGNQNQTGMTLDGTGNYTGGTYYDNAFNGFQTAVNAIGHQAANVETTDWVNASTFVRLHINCPTSGGSPIAGTYGFNLQAGDGNTFTGGDVEGCATALHLGAGAKNNTIVGLRNENSTSQVVADAGSAYNSWITGGTMFTGGLTDNGTRNSFLDTFHRSFNGINGDWYGSQQDATVTNHYRLGIGSGNERGYLDRYQTDYGYRWTMGLSDAAAGEQFYQVMDELNNVNRISIGQYNNGQSSTNNQTVINSAGTGAIVLNGSNNAGTGGVVIGSGGTSATAVATIDKSGNTTLNGTLQVGGTTKFIATPTVKNSADAEVDVTLWAGSTVNQKEAVVYKDYTGTSQWYLLKDSSNNWVLNSAVGGLDSFKAYQSTNSGDTYINASNSTGAVRVNYESGSGSSFNVYGGNSSTLYASFTGAAAIKFPGLAATNAHSCLQIDSSGWITNTGAACGSSGGSGTVTSVGLSAPSTVFSVSATPVTSYGTIALGLNTQSPNTFMAGPASGTAAATPGFRAIASADLPSTIAANTTGSAASLSGASVLPSGTTATTQTAGNNSTNVATTAYADNAVSVEAARAAAAESTNAAALTAARSAANSALPLAGGTLTGVLNSSYGGTNSFAGPVAASAILPGKVGGVINASACGYANPPSWCSGSEVGAWVNAAFTQLNGNPGTVTLDPSVTYNQTIPIVKPATAWLDCQGSVLNWAGSTGKGAAVVMASPLSIWNGGGLNRCTISQNYNASNTNYGVYLGGDPAGVISPTAYLASNQTIRDSAIIGFKCGLTHGENTWALRITGTSFVKNYDHVCALSGMGNSGENMTIVQSQLSNSYDVALNLQVEEEWNVIGSWCDYNANGCAKGDVDLWMSNTHIEASNGPLFNLTGGKLTLSNDLIGITGTTSAGEQGIINVANSGVSVSIQDTQALLVNYSIPYWVYSSTATTLNLCAKGYYSPTNPVSMLSGTSFLTVQCPSGPVTAFNNGGVPLYAGSYGQTAANFYNPSLAVGSTYNLQIGKSQYPSNDQAAVLGFAAGASDSANSGFAGMNNGNAAYPNLSWDVNGYVGVGPAVTPTSDPFYVSGAGAIYDTYLKASSGYACLHVDSTGAITNNGADCGTATLPLTAQGDTLYQGGSSAARLAGNTSTTPMYLTQTGTGSASAAPVWANPFAASQTVSSKWTFNSGINATWTSYGASNISPTNTATSGTNYPSWPIGYESSIYHSAASAAVTYFAGWEAEPASNSSDAALYMTFEQIYNPNSIGMAVDLSKANLPNKLGDTVVKSVQQPAANYTGGSCSMAAATSCTLTVTHSYTTPICVATVQGTTPVAGSCRVSGTTVTVTAASSNSQVWGVLIFGNPS
ncbi:MAG: hypothetical protein P4K83_11075 [Terracidiphilus sp.]|nr:hypothetical protein [Terracidiphilus sp.]